MEISLRTRKTFSVISHVIVRVVSMIMNCAIEIKRIRTPRLCPVTLRLYDSSIKPVNALIHVVLEACWTKLGTRQVQLECVDKG